MADGHRVVNRPRNKSAENQVPIQYGGKIGGKVASRWKEWRHFFIHLVILNANYFVDAILPLTTTDKLYNKNNNNKNKKLHGRHTVLAGTTQEPTRHSPK